VGLYEDAIEAFRSGATARTEVLSLELLSDARESGDLSGQVDALSMLARIALRRGDLDHVIALAQEALGLARRAGERRLERMPIHMHAVAVRMRGDFSAARLLYEESIEVNVQFGDKRMIAVEHRNLAYVELHDGHPDLARQLFGLAAQEARALGYDALEPFLLLDSAVVAFEDGDRDRAGRMAAAARVALSEAGQIPDPDDAAEEERLEAELFYMGSRRASGDEDGTY
jgi:ATP/maltotriose-dependent transcriptional regulator MalT